MARRRRGASIKTTRQSRKIKESEKVNGQLAPSDPGHDDFNCLIESDSVNVVNDTLACVTGGNCIGASGTGDPVLHHKKFGKIRVSGRTQISIDLETGKEYGKYDTKQYDDSEPDATLESSKFSNDAGVMDIMRGIEISAPKGQNSYVDFRKQSSVYKVENDIPLDGSVIIKPGTFSSNTITSSVKPNLFFNVTTASEINSVNFLKVLQGIEMLERNVTGNSSIPLEYDDSLPKQEKDFLMDSSSLSSLPAYINAETDSKSLYVDSEHSANSLKAEDEMSESTIKEIEDLKTEDCGKTTDVSSPDDESSDVQNEAEETAKKLENIVLDDSGEAGEVSGASRAGDEATETMEKKSTAGGRSRSGSAEAAGLENGSPSGATIRRSNRIRSIGIMKLKEREQAVRSDCVMKNTPPPGSPASVAASMPGYDDKPVKVKSRWRRSSELEMHGTVKGIADSESVSSNCASPVNMPPHQFPVNTEPTPEDLERFEREKKDIEEGLSSFNILTENEYKMERSACKETKRMICDCVLTKEDISRGEVGCGEDCLNRMLFLECGSRCALGDRCTNKRFQKLQYANCKIFKTEKKGFGLRAEEDLAGNTFIMEYVGEVVNQKEFARRVKMYAKENNKHFYFMALKGDAIIDATNKGNISRFINHSCDPNAETQKWTINGELRVGFFTRRFVHAGEEITFDYQFQRYGKQAQKCYCEAPNCRGWIGENPDDSIEDDEEEEEEEEDEEDEEDEGTEEEEEESKKEIRKTTKQDEDKERKEEAAKHFQPSRRKIKTERKVVVRKKKERKTTTIVDDMGLDEEIQKLCQTGLKNRAHTLTLSRLMIRAEDWSTRGKLLKLIREGETPCRRLFLDYHGLRLICGWMLSRELEASIDRNECRLEILKTLLKLPIPNKNMLLDSKILSVVEQWAKSSFILRKLSVDEEITNDEKKPKPEEIIPGLGGEIEETLPNSETKNDGEQEKKDGSESGERVKRMAESVLESWSTLKEVFKIPKKERIEQMKEHERQADRGYGEYLDNKENVRDKYDRHDRYGRSDRFRDRDRIRKRTRESPPDPEWFRNHERHSKMTKHERRQLFALKVLQEDEEAKKRNEHLEMWKQHESRCLALGLDPNINAACDPQTGFPIFFDHATGTWQNCPPSAGPSPSMPHSVTPTMCPSPMYSVGGPPPIMQNCQSCPMCTNIPIVSNMNNPSCHNGMMHNNLPMTNGPPCPPQSYPNMTPQYQGPMGQSNFDGMETAYQETGDPCGMQVGYDDSSVSDANRPVITEIPLNYPIKLPPKWKAAKDAKGRVYFYHVKERVSQWEPPQWTEEDAKIEAARTVDMEMGEDSSSSTESSTDTSSEDEEEDAENGEAKSEEKSTEEANTVEKAEENVEAGERLADGVGSPKNETTTGQEEEEKDEDLSAWEDEEDVVKTSKSAGEAPPTNPPEKKRQPSLPAAQPAKGRRAGLVQEIMISPRREEDRVDNRKFKEIKEMLRRQKEEARMKEKLRLKGDTKVAVRLSRNRKKRNKEKTIRSSRSKGDKTVSAPASDSSTDRKIKENFKNSMAGAIVSHLNPYRKQDCKIGRITCNEDFKHLARKLTHFVMLKELKHCRGIDDLECNDSVKAKAKDFIKKYMAKFGAVYQRPQHEVWRT